MNDLSFVELLNFSELTGSLSTIYALLFGALAFLGYHLVAEIIWQGQQLANSDKSLAGCWEDYTLPTNQLSRGVVIPLLSDTWSEENQQVLEASGLVDQDSSWVLDDDSYWGIWTEADRLAIEALANVPVIPPLDQVCDPNPLEGEAAALNGLTLEELIGKADAAEDEDTEVWAIPEFWARHI